MEQWCFYLSKPSHSLFKHLKSFSNSWELNESVTFMRLNGRLFLLNHLTSVVPSSAEDPNGHRYYRFVNIAIYRPAESYKKKVKGKTN